MPKSDCNLTGPARKITALAKNSPLHIVGGAVRDRILNLPTLDLDITLPDHPLKLAKETAKALKGKVVVLDEERAVVRVVLGKDKNVDFSRYQGKNFEADIRRRDFTLNALAVPLTQWASPQWKKHIVDLTGGKKDLEKKILTGLAEKNFKEDPLRVLRGFRLAAQFGFSISSKTLGWMKKNAKGLKKVSPERIREEMMKMFSGSASKAVWDMEKAGVWDVLMPESKKLRSTAPNYYGKGGVMKHTLNTLVEFEELENSLKSWFPKHHKKIESYLREPLPYFPRSAYLKWACLLHDLGKPATAEMREGRLRFFEHEHVGADMVAKMGLRYRWSTDETRRYAMLTRNHMRAGNLASHAPISDRAIHRFFRDLDHEGVGMLLVSLADHLTYLSKREKKKRDSDHETATIMMINRFLSQPAKILPPKILDGHDIMKEFKLKPSPLIGQLLKEVMEAQSEGKMKTKADALKFLKKKVDVILKEQRD